MRLADISSSAASIRARYSALDCDGAAGQSCTAPRNLGVAVSKALRCALFFDVTGTGGSKCIQAYDIADAVRGGRDGNEQT
jgi:hypothetical protein